MKILSTFLLLIIVLMLSSCSFFRSIGLYNVPPNYSETYEEINGQKFIEHPNKKENLILMLKTVKSEYSPYEEVELSLKIFNISNKDTMYILAPSLYTQYPTYSRLIVADTLGNNLNVVEYYTHGNPITIVDDYGRKIKNTLAPNHTKIDPRDSITIILRYRAGDRICDHLDCKLTFKRENNPGKYNAYYLQYHEEYDEVKGPTPVELKSSEISYKISNYTIEEIEIRNEVNEIISSVYSNKDSLVTNSLFSQFAINHPNNFYSPQIQEFLKMSPYIRKRSKN